MPTASSEASDPLPTDPGGVEPRHELPLVAHPHHHPRTDDDRLARPVVDDLGGRDDQLRELLRRACPVLLDAGLRPDLVVGAGAVAADHLADVRLPGPHPGHRRGDVRGAGRRGVDLGRQPEDDERLRAAGARGGDQRVEPRPVEARARLQGGPVHVVGRQAHRAHRGVREGGLQVRSMHPEEPAGDRTARRGGQTRLHRQAQDQHDGRRHSSADPCTRHSPEPHVSPHSPRDIRRRREATRRSALARSRRRQTRTGPGRVHLPGPGSSRRRAQAVSRRPSRRRRRRPWSRWSRSSSPRWRWPWRCSWPGSWPRSCGPGRWSCGPGRWSS